MKTALLSFILSLCPSFLEANTTTADSLKALFTHAVTQQERADRCLNLDNYYRNVLLIDSIPLTQVLLKEGIKARNEYIISDALRKLVMSIDRKRRVLTNDSVIYYLKIADTYLTDERKRSFMTEIQLRHIRSIADWTNDESQTIQELTEKYTNPEKNSDDIYFQIERNYALGMIAALSISENETNSYKNASRYFDRLFELIQKLPLDYGAELLFCVNENIYTCYINGHENEKVVAFLEKMIAILERYKMLPDLKKDTYQNFEFIYSLYYQGISEHPQLVGNKKATDCLKSLDAILRRRGDLLFLYYAYNGFYENSGDYKMAILYGDSIVNYFQKSNYPVKEAVASSMYQHQAEWYAALKDYRNAYEHMQKYDTIQQKIINEKAQELRAEMDARYDLSHLELEKERLTSRNREIAIFFILFIFTLSVVWGISQWYNLQKLKRVQKKLVESNAEVIRQSELAKESEKMKTAFVNSMCHEIRTPLNAVNGFSNLLLDESIDVECKKEFSELIQKNTDFLNRMLNNLAEVSNLNNTMEKLPMEQADIRTMCIEEMEKLKFNEGKEDILYNIDIEEQLGTIRTNILYLSRTISHLLSNANKFTASGKITLGCYRDTDEQLTIKVTDTGVGIPIEKQEWVFERFTKLDDFKPGVGLGLCICRSIVNRLGGTLVIDSNYTDGTSFVLTLPA